MGFVFPAIFSHSSLFTAFDLLFYFVASSRNFATALYARLAPFTLQYRFIFNYRMKNLPVKLDTAIDYLASFRVHCSRWVSSQLFVDFNILWNRFNALSFESILNLETVDCGFSNVDFVFIIRDDDGDNDVDEMNNFLRT